MVEPETNAKLKVSFFWPFRGDYWILELGGEYEYSVVLAPSMEYLWILSRTPELSEQTLAGIEGRLEGLGFDTGNLIYNTHEPVAPPARCTKKATPCGAAFLFERQ